MQTTAVVKKWGNSLGVVIDSKTTKKLGIKEGQEVKIDIEPNIRISAFGKFKFFKTPLERDRDREL